jgi:hypothetical protein
MFNNKVQGKTLLDVSAAPQDQLNVVVPTIPSPYPLGRSDSGKTLHNKAASGTVTVLLPSDANIGDHFEVLEESAHNIVLDPTAANGLGTGTNATGAIHDPLAGTTTTATTGLYTSSAIGSSCEIVCIGTGPLWTVFRKQGTWTVS